MTDKQIIIDGVDVSGCEFATKAEMAHDTHCRLYDYKYCIGKDCLYKQLKRKEQECERLKKEAIKRSKELIRIRKERQEGQEMNRNLHKQLDQLKQTLAEIKGIAKYELNNLTESAINGGRYVEILQKISEVE